MGVATRQLSARRRRRSPFVAGFAEVEVDVETGKYQILDYLAVADVGTVINPRSLRRPDARRRRCSASATRIGQKWVYDQHYGVPLAKRFYHNKPPTILDAPAKMQWAALDIPDPETPVGARGIGEPPVGAGYGADHERDRGRGRRRGLPPRAGDAGHDSDVARSGQAGCTSRSRPTFKRWTSGIWQMGSLSHCRSTSSPNARSLRL